MGKTNTGRGQEKRKEKSCRREKLLKASEIKKWGKQIQDADRKEEKAKICHREKQGKASGIEKGRKQIQDADRKKEKRKAVAARSCSKHQK